MEKRGEDGRQKWREEEKREKKQSVRTLSRGPILVSLVTMSK